MVIQGEVDAVVSVRNGRAAAQVWADAAGALAGAERGVQRGKRYPMTVTDFKSRGVTVATLVEVGRLGHAWSGGAHDQASATATGRMRRAWRGPSRRGSSATA